MSKVYTVFLTLSISFMKFLYPCKKVCGIPLVSYKREDKSPFPRIQQASARELCKAKILFLYAIKVLTKLNT